MRNYILKYLNAFLIILGLFVSKSAHSAIYMVTSNADAGVNTLRQAIINANASPGADSISFNFGVPTTITLASCLPNITGQVVINGYTDPGASVGVLTIEVISPAGCNGFYFGTGSDGSTIKGIVISGGTTGIYLASSNNHTVKGNYLGTTKSGTAIAASRLQDCIHLNTSNNSTIGGTGGQIDRNILSGATQDGIRLENSLRTTIVNNYIG
ncbi:MAG TPA: NosD domain-containing protein, partial [Cytophagaceae bacterium]|nr:NosD domain-containing protein [Cytophagaceae bacterium]